MLVFANPMFLWALTAAAIPLMLHMFQRRKTVVTPFPTLRFLKAAQKRSSSRIKFENFLLKTMGELLKIMWTFSEATIKVYNSVKNMPTSHLVHPIALEVPAPSVSTISAEERLKNAMLALSYK